MYVPEAMQLNKFKAVRIRSNFELFNLVSHEGTIPASAFTGDELAVMPQNKLDAIRQADYELRDQLSNE